ncbi:MAG: hypothetical protein RLZZ306_1916 [Bacteroidota bacterium]
MLVGYICTSNQTSVKMKNKFLYIIFAFVVLTTSTGFGFLESSTIMHGRENRQIKADSLKNVSPNLQFSNNPQLVKKEIDKPENHQITKSIIQWTANFLKNTLQILLNVIIDAGKVILMAIVRFFIG